MLRAITNRILLIGDAPQRALEPARLRFCETIVCNFADRSISDWMVRRLDICCSIADESLGFSGSWFESSVNMIFTNSSLLRLLNASRVPAACVGEFDEMPDVEGISVLRVRACADDHRAGRAMARERRGLHKSFVGQKEDRGAETSVYIGWKARSSQPFGASCRK